MEIDPVQQAEELAQIFFQLSNAVDQFRLDHFAAIPPAKQAQLKEQAQALDTRGQQYTAAALGAILQQIQPHLQNIRKATKDAQDALVHLNDVAKALAIVDATVKLVGSIVSGDVGSIGDGLEDMFKSIGS